MCACVCLWAGECLSDDLVVRLACVCVWAGERLSDDLLVRLACVCVSRGASEWWRSEWAASRPWRLARQCQLRRSASAISLFHVVLLYYAIISSRYSAAILCLLVLLFANVLWQVFMHKCRHQALDIIRWHSWHDRWQATVFITLKTQCRQ